MRGRAAADSARASRSLPSRTSQARGTQAGGVRASLVVRRQPARERRQRQQALHLEHARHVARRPIQRTYSRCQSHRLCASGASRARVACFRVLRAHVRPPCRFSTDFRAAAAPPTVASAWNTLTGAGLSCVDTGSQVCNLMWSKNVNEVRPGPRCSRAVRRVTNHRADCERTARSTRSSFGDTSMSARRASCVRAGASAGARAAVHRGRSRLSRGTVPCALPDVARQPDVVTGAGDETLRFWNGQTEIKEGSRLGSGLCSPRAPT